MTQGFNAQTLTAIDDLPGSLSQRVYQSLQEAIMSLRFPPGALIRKGAICDELGVSRSPVSEAITRLASEGLVDVIPQSGTRVARFSIEEIREAAFMREALEVAAVEKVALDHTPEQYAKLARNVRLQAMLVEDNDAEGFYQADEEFHALLMEFTGFPGVAAAVATISLKLKRPRMLLLPTPGRSADAVREHLAIVEAVRDRDAEEARAAMRYHLRQLIGRFDPLEVNHPEFFRMRQTN